MILARAFCSEAGTVVICIFRLLENERQLFVCHSWNGVAFSSLFLSMSFLPSSSPCRASANAGHRREKMCRDVSTVAQIPLVPLFP